MSQHAWEQPGLTAEERALAALTHHADYEFRFGEEEVSTVASAIRAAEAALESRLAETKGVADRALSREATLQAQLREAERERDGQLEIAVRNAEAALRENQRATAAERERDAYRKAKAENDERFQNEAGEWQARATAAEARVLDAENVADQMRSQRDAAQEGERRAEARVREVEGALREACDEFKDALGYVPEWAQEKYDYDGTLARLRALLTPTAPAREGECHRCVERRDNLAASLGLHTPTNLDGRGEGKLCHFPICLCPGATECEAERYEAPTGRGEVGRG